MLPASAQQIVETLDESAVVLDIGGWADPFWRADWVMDLMPYESRGYYERRGWTERSDGPEDRFSEETWICRDICDRQPYPFGDGEIDFVVCAHTLEDIRDPVWVCSEMNRIARTGYIEVPSRLEEQTFGIGGELVGWGHHRWLIDVEPGAIQFVFKWHGLHLHPDQYFPAGFSETLSPEERAQQLWWDGSFDYGEKFFVETEPYFDYLRALVADVEAQREAGRPGLAGKLWARAKRLRTAA